MLYQPSISFKIQNPKDCLILAKSVSKKLETADEHLRMLQTSFEKFPDTDIEKVWASRKFLRNYRNEVIKNYETDVRDSAASLG